MITTFPDDFSTETYDVRTTDGTLWQFVTNGSDAALVSGGLQIPLMVLDGRVTVFQPGYRNINIHGFDIDGVHYELESAVRNEKWEPQPEPDMPVLYAKERAFVAKLLEYATAFGVDLAALPDINISVMLDAAHKAGASEIQIATASSILLALTRDIEAEAGMVWSACWLALKYRLRGYLEELTTTQPTD